MGDTITLEPKARVRVIRESSKTSWRQGIHLSVDGHFNVDVQTFRKAIVLWADTAPDIVLIGVCSKDGACHVKNVWDTGDGTMHSWHNGGAMIVEQTDCARRYRCNDGNPNDDFDDIIFRLEPVDGGTTVYGNPTAVWGVK